MSTNPDLVRFRSEELVLKVDTSVDRRIWDESRYEAFLDELCDTREYQKEAIRTALRYLLAGEYPDLRALARRNFEANNTLRDCYGTWASFERRLQLPDVLSATLDLATGTGKSFVLYGIAAIMLAEGAVDRVLLLCPSTTIEAGLTGKFRALAGDGSLRDLIPATAQTRAPRIVSANETIVEGAICIENYHAVLQHVGSSIRESLVGRGSRVLVLNDEAHHVANDGAAAVKRWKEFLIDPDFGFHFVLGVSGTCYVGNEYFADVIYRYSLRRAMDERYVKRVDYVGEMPRTRQPDDRWQLVRNRHEENRGQLSLRSIRPLTIVVTSTIARCQEVAEDLVTFLVEHERVDFETARRRVLAVYSGAPDLRRLPTVDTPASPVEWIVSVSMLNEGWDVKRVFQIVPHEERAFNSRLLVSQVLGRGLRIPEGWTGDAPTVTVFNHDAWAGKIKHVVDDVLERERRLTARVIADSELNFEIHQVDYSLRSTAASSPMEGNYNLLAKGFVDLASDSPVHEASVEFIRAGTEARYEWRSRIHHRAYSPVEIAQAMFERLQEADDPEDAAYDPEQAYTRLFPLSRLEEIVRASIARIGATEVTDSMRQRLLQALGTLRRRTSESVRYDQEIDAHRYVSTSTRPSDGVSAADLRRSKAIFFTNQTRGFIDDQQVELFDEVSDSGAGWRSSLVGNRYDFKTPLNLVIADSENERRFIRELVKPENANFLEGWIKSTSIGFYEIDFAWKKGAHAKRGKFSPDFFIKTENIMLVVEIKGDEELTGSSEENRKKNEFAINHFARINDEIREKCDDFQYKFIFLTPVDFGNFFLGLRNADIVNFRSELDVVLATPA